MNTSQLFDFLGRVLMAVAFVSALPGKLTDFAGTVSFIASKGLPVPLASFLLTAAIVVLIASSILFVVGGNNTIRGASLLLVFLVPTTLIFHTFPMDDGFFMNIALIGALILGITRSRGNAVPSFNHLRSKN